MTKTYYVAIILSIFVSFGGILFGYDTGTISGVQENSYWQQQFGNTLNSDGTITISTSQKSMIVSILSVGTFFGALAAAPFGDFLGRKWALFASCWVFSVGVAMQTASTGIGLFTGGRVIAGLGVGLVSCLVPMYQAEAAPHKIRGAIIGCYQFAVTVGILVASVVNNACQNVYSNSGWRWVIAVQFLFAGILAVGMLFLPDTPRSLIRKGKMEDAARSLARLRSASVDDPEVKAELEEIRANLEYEKQIGQATYLDCFNGVSLRRSLIGIFIQMFQQLTGVNFIFYYGTTFFKIAGFSNAFLAAMITTIVNVASTLPGLYMVERLGRRKLLLFGAVVMTISQFIVGIVGATAAKGREDSPQAALNTIIAFICIFIFGFACSWGPVAWVLTGELFTLKTRAKQMSMATASNWFWNWLLAFVTPYMVDTKASGGADLGTNIAFLWGGLNFACLAYVYFIIPETRGLTLEQVDELFEKHVTPRKSAKWVPTESYAEILRVNEKTNVDPTQQNVERRNGTGPSAAEV